MTLITNYKGRKVLAGAGFRGRIEPYSEVKAPLPTYTLSGKQIGRAAALLASRGVDFALQTAYADLATINNQSF